MPPRGTKKGTERARQYEHVKDSLRDRGSSESEAEEIAARTVNKERARSGEARTSSKLSREDISSGRRGGLRSQPGPARPHARPVVRGGEDSKHQGRSKMTKAEFQRALGGAGGYAGFVSARGLAATVSVVIEAPAERLRAGARSRDGLRRPGMPQGAIRCVDLAVPTGHTTMVVDLGGSDSLDADLLGVLHRSGRRMREAGGRFAVVRAALDCGGCSTSLC